MSTMETLFVAGQTALIKGLNPNAPDGCVPRISWGRPPSTCASRLGRGHANIGASIAYSTSNPCPSGMTARGGQDDVAATAGFGGHED